MKRLSVILTLAFVAITLVTVLTVALLAGYTVDTEFRRYVMRRDMFMQNDLPDTLAEFYESMGNWDGVGAMMGAGRGMMRGRGNILLADSEGVIVYDLRGARLGMRLSDEELANALPITIEGQTVGYMPMMPGMMQQADVDFLSHLQRILAVAAVIAGGIGITLGIITSRTITAPLASLSTAARAFAAHRWEHRAPVRGADEIAGVARAFNAMADELQQAEALRRNLMADIAHELRTPLTVIQGNLRALLDGVYPLELREIATIYDETRLLSRLVADLRELALAEAGQLPLNIQTVDVLPVLRAAMDNFSLAAETQQTTLSLSENGMLQSVRADPDRLAQVLYNLLSNALRHTHAGNITISVSQLPGQARISVADTGAGISPEDLPHVFDRFYRADESRARSSGGSGLGLSIARTWVEAMGGQIGVDSALGRGSTFWFTLSTAPSRSPARAIP